MKGQVDIKIGDKVMAILGPVGKYAGTVFAIRHEGKHRIAIFKDEEGVVYETPVYNLTKDVPAKGRYPRKNPVSPTGIYTNFDEWRADAKKAGAVRFEGGKDNLTGLNAKGSGIADWDGVEGWINKRIKHDDGKTNPVRPRRGESERDFVSRCMSEEKQSFPKQKQRIAVCLSKARRNPFPDRNADE